LILEDPKGAAGIMGVSETQEAIGRERLPKQELVAHKEFCKLID
jgi:hypothetical protein